MSRQNDSIFEEDDEMRVMDEYCADAYPYILICQVADRFISVRPHPDGYEYAIYDETYSLLEKDTFDPPTYSMRRALDVVIEDLAMPETDRKIRGAVTGRDIPRMMDYQEFLSGRKEVWADSSKMWKKKRILAERLLEQNLTLIYMADDFPTVFLATDSFNGEQISKLVQNLGITLLQPPKSGFYATQDSHQTGFWLTLK